MKTPTCLTVTIGAALLSLMGTTALGQAADVDWKVFGGTSVSGSEICFYDAKGVVRMRRGFVRVWTKCLSQQDLEKVDVQHDFKGRIAASAARKRDNGYVPPIALIEDGIDFNKATVVAVYEETANIAPIQPRAIIFYELNCAGRMLRERSITIFANEVKLGSTKTTSSWHQIAAETNVAKLLKMLCPQ